MGGKTKRAAGKWSVPRLAEDAGIVEQERIIQDLQSRIKGFEAERAAIPTDDSEEKTRVIAELSKGGFPETDGYSGRREEEIARDIKLHRAAIAVAEGKIQEIRKRLADQATAQAREVVQGHMALAATAMRNFIDHWCNATGVIHDLEVAGLGSSVDQGGWRYIVQRKLFCVYDGEDGGLKSAVRRIERCGMLPAGMASALSRAAESGFRTRPDWDGAASAVPVEEGDEADEADSLSEAMEAEAVAADTGGA